ncbi:MAG: energy-coupling factor transporter transmembrane component T [Motilibacteraceae bacterium]
MPLPVPWVGSLLPARWSVPRHLHPGAWWVWALGLATAASRTTDPLLLGLALAVAAYVVSARRTDAPWARSFRSFLVVGAVVVAARVVFAVLLGTPVEGPTVVLDLPQVPLPSAFAGIRLGGPVSLEGLAAALYEGLRLATLLACVGAANALASPSRLLRSVPGALYEAGVALVVAMTFAPQLVESVGRVRAARRLRGRPDRGLKGLRGVAMPVLEGALERSLELAAAMDSRGYGRRADVPAAARRTTAALVLAGLLGVCAGLYGLLDGGTPGVLGLPVLVAGCAAAACGLVLGGRRTPRSRYRPDRWAAQELLVAGAGVVAAAGMVAASVAGVGGLAPATNPLEVPGLPVLPTAALLVALLPAWLAPPPVRATPTAGRARAARDDGSGSTQVGAGREGRAAR